MEQTTQHKSKERDLFESQIRDCYGRTVYSHKTHEKMADISLKWLSRIKITQIALSAITTTTLLYTIFGNSLASTVIAAISSTILLGATLYTKDYDLGEIAQKHSEAANKLWLIRESFLSLLIDTRAGDTDMDKLREKRDDLNNELKNIYSGAPRTNSKAYKLAQKSLKHLEELTFSDNELDQLLPENLRKIGRES